MPQIDSVEELLDRIGGVITSPDPFGELRSRGLRLSAGVQAALGEMRPVPRHSPVERQRLALLAGRLGRVRSTVSEAVTTAADALPEGEYDVVAGLRLSTLNDTLAAL